MNHQANKYLHLLAGPTAVGKTDLALQWAEKNDAEIVSCDSLLFYRGMNIGTARPESDALAKVRHHCIDMVPVDQPFNVGHYQRVALEAVRSILDRGKKVLITGGSGFYLKGFVAPVVDCIAIPETISSEVELWFRREGIEGLVERLKRASPDDYHQIDLQNPRRLIPALKRCLASGLSLSALRDRMGARGFPFASFPTVSVLLQRSMQDLENRIRQRTRMMLDSGLVDEVRQLLEQGMERNPSAVKAIGYREVIAHLRGEVEARDLQAMIEANTVKLVKKQIKWFRTQMQFDQVINLSSEGSDTLQHLFEHDG